MSRLRIKQTNETPPDKYRYVHPEDGHKTIAIGADDWFAAILKHKRDNGYAVPDDWKEQAEDQLCRTLPPGWCMYEDGSDPASYINPRIGVDDVIHGTKVLIEFVRQGAPLVTPEVAEARGKTCSSCFLNMQIPGCVPCLGISNMIADVAGVRATQADGMLKMCAWCKCSARANIWVPTEVSGVGVTDEMLNLAPEWCWKANEIRAQRALVSEPA